MKNSLLNGVGLALAAVLASPSAIAAAPLVASGSASLSNVQFTLNDFRPDDGIAAGMNWAAAGVGWLAVDCCDTGGTSRQLDIYGDKFNNRVSNGVSLPGNVASAYRTADGAQVAISIDSDHIGAIYDGGKFDPGSSLSAQGYVTEYGFELVLKPGTELRLTGDTTFDASINLLNTTAYGMPGFRDLAASVRGESRLQAYALSGNDSLEFLVKPQGPDAYADGSVGQVKSAGKITEGTSEIHQSKSFTYVIRNNGLVDQSLGLSLYTSVHFFGDYADAVSVPEPESMALMAVGLVSLAWARRRQQRSKLNKQAAALCLGAALLPVGAQAAPTVSAEGAIHSNDALGETHGGFGFDKETEPFSYASAAQPPTLSSGGGWFPPPYLDGFLAAGVSNSGGGFGVNISTYRWEKDWLSEELTAPVVSSSAKIDWSDTVVNTHAQASGVFIDFALPRLTWALSDDVSFKASIWIDDPSAPLWSTGLTRQHDASLGHAVNVFSGRDIGLRGDAYLANLALSQQVYLGSLPALGSFKVHFSIEMAASGNGASMSFYSSAPSFRLVTSPVPEPSSVVLSLAGLGLAGLFVRRRQAV